MRRDRARILRVVLIGILAVATLGVTVRALLQVTAAARFDDLVAAAPVDRPAPDAKPEEDDGHQKEPGGENGKPEKKKDESTAKSVHDRRADKVTSRSLFIPVPKKSLSVKLMGILGDEAIFNGNKVGRVGGKVGGAEITAIGPDWVDLLWEGKTVRQWVFGPRRLDGAIVSPRRLKVPDGWEPPARILERIAKMAPKVRLEAMADFPDKARKMILEILSSE